MKKIKLLLLFGITIVSLGSFINHSGIRTNAEKEKLHLSKNGSFENYRVTAKTRNQYGDNYWVDLIVEGKVATYGNSIYKVYYNDGNGLKSMRYYTDYDYKNSYYVVIDRNEYYFSF